ncbi:hypothetical protein BCO26_1827 [Heyndrickxia coagulans 2-6]|nr:hypothetical protein BCO26_1827 [Heyndrickxia coagulans 2-6]
MIAISYCHYYHEKKEDCKANDTEWKKFGEKRRFFPVQTKPSRHFIRMKDK